MWHRIIASQDPIIYRARRARELEDSSSPTAEDNEEESDSAARATSATTYICAGYGIQGAVVRHDVARIPSGETPQVAMATSNADSEPTHDAAPSSRQRETERTHDRNESDRQSSDTARVRSGAANSIWNINKVRIPGSEKLYKRLVISFVSVSILGLVLLVVGSVFLDQARDIYEDSGSALLMIWCIIFIGERCMHILAQSG